MCVPFTLRGFPEHLNGLKVNNDFACVPFWLRFPKDKQTNKRVFIYRNGKLPYYGKLKLKNTVLSLMADLRQTMRTKRAKFEAIGWYYMMKYFLFFLRVPLVYQPTGVASYYHSVLSLVPGPKE